MRLTPAGKRREELTGKLLDYVETADGANDSVRTAKEVIRAACGVMNLTDLSEFVGNYVDVEEETVDKIDTDFTIPAECHSDDHSHEVDFDALPWFEQASDDEIVALAAIDWGGDQEADEVAIFCQDHNNELNALFNYLDKIKNKRSHKDMCGFECHVEEVPAMEWLRTHKRTAWERVRKARGDED